LPIRFDFPPLAFDPLSIAGQIVDDDFMRLILSILVLNVLMPLTVTASAQTLTAGEAIQRIRQRYPGSVPPDTVDTIKVGDAATPVTGIATTFLDTMDVLREAARRGDSLVVTHEPTFYNHRDDTSFFTSDPVYREKLAFIQQHHMVVFRLHDGIHATPPDHIALGLIQALGWQSYIQAGNPFFATIPQTTLVKLVRELQDKLNIQTLRVVGDPNLSVTRVALRPGASGLEEQVLALRRDDVQVLIAGEASEWETVEYARDAGAQGRKKALILLGHEVSEEPGMEQCTEDLRTLFPHLRVDHIAAGQPLWNPDRPPAPRSRN
jgi:putative NIF3 family GTP cyclohydrolase 1 type 2